MSLDLPEDVKEASLSARLVYAAMQGQGWTRPTEIADATGLATSTVSNAKAELQDLDRIECRQHPENGLYCQYRLAGGDA